MARKHTVGDRRRWVVDYTDWLVQGDYLATAGVVSSSGTATVDTVSVDPDARHVIFFLNGGVLNEAFTVTVTITDTLSQVKENIFDFIVIAP